MLELWECQNQLWDVGKIIFDMAKGSQKCQTRHFSGLTTVGKRVGDRLGGLFDAMTHWVGDRLGGLFGAMTHWVEDRLGVIVLVTESFKQYFNNII